MQRIFNGMAVVAFSLSTSLTAALVISFVQFDKIQDEAIKRLTGQITGAVTGELDKKLDGQLDGVVEMMPKSTGPALPFKGL